MLKKACTGCPYGNGEGFCALGMPVGGLYKAIQEGGSEEALFFAGPVESPCPELDLLHGMALEENQAKEEVDGVTNVGCVGCPYSLDGEEGMECEKGWAVTELYIAVDGEETVTRFVVPLELPCPAIPA
jgi:hypothetical protein